MIIKKYKDVLNFSNSAVNVTSLIVPQLCAGELGRCEGCSRTPAELWSVWRCETAPV